MTIAKFAKFSLKSEPPISKRSEITQKKKAYPKPRNYAVPNLQE